MNTTMYPPETGWIVAEQADLRAAAGRYSSARAGSRPRTRRGHRFWVLGGRPTWTRKAIRTGQAR
jgi:hypothetical protein